ncbi:AMP-binding protein [Ruegeria sp. MALMAid1280]|uniref:AMP-binding protein n=1 Tax=Ruegeria sp. MALMAid1280 TaxID=3411634 RepID=UPI003BA27176
MTETTISRQKRSYADVTAGFRIETAAADLAGDMIAGVNACVECCDRHVPSGGVALDWISERGDHRAFSFAEMQDLSARVANMLTARGVRPGDVVSGMLPRTPDLLAVILGTWRAAAVYQPLFTAFGPKAIEQRLQTSQAKIIVTDLANRAKLDDVPNRPMVAVVLDGHETAPNGDVDFRSDIATQSTEFEPVPRKGSDLFLMMSTSGTTGLPKGVPVPLCALMSFSTYMHDAIDLRPDDGFWNIADPGWAYGLYYAVTGPLMIGHQTTFSQAPFTVENTYDIIGKLGITNFAGAPTAFRMLVAAGPDAAAQIKGKLRVVSSAGEPLNPEIIRWFRAHLDAPIHDHYGQTELGMVVNNHHGLDHPVRPGSAGVAMPGYRVVVLDDQGRELSPNSPGTLAVDIEKSPLLWFTGYHKKETPAIADGYYRTGDTVELEADGSVGFIGRDDDVITSSGYRIGPFDVESALIEHGAVNEAAVVGVPDPTRTEIVKAFVVLASGIDGSAELVEELQLYVKEQLSAHAYPRAIEFVPNLPKTPSGKIQRFLLRQAEIEKQTDS